VIGPKVKVKRDNKYYLQRMKKDAPNVYADYLAGKYKSVREARRVAGLLAESSPLQLLKTAWKKADATQRKQFFAWTRSGLPTPSKIRSLFDPDGRLTNAGKTELKRTLKDHGMDISNLMSAIGRSRLDPSMSLALIRGYRVSPHTRKLVDHWFAKHGSP
jgi:hypothetical protein